MIKNMAKKKCILLCLLFLVVLLLLVVILLSFELYKPLRSSEKYNGSYKIGFKNFSNDTTVYITVTNTIGTVIYKSNTYVQKDSYKYIALPLAEGNYSIEVRTTENKSVRYSVTISENTPNETYLFVIEDNKISIAGYPKD